MLSVSSTITNFYHIIENILSCILQNEGFSNIQMDKKFDLDGKIYRPDIIAERDLKKYVIEIKLSKIVSPDIVNDVYQKYKIFRDYHIILVLPFAMDNTYEKIIPNMEIWDAAELTKYIENISNEKVKDEKLQSLFALYRINDLPFKQFQNCKNKSVIIEESLLNTLKYIKEGRKDAYNFEEFAIEFLKYVFADDIVEPRRRHRTSSGVNIFDAIARISSLRSESDFFDIIKSHFNTRYVIFECKNYKKKISQREVFITTKYLCNKALRNVAIIFTRNGENEGATKIRKQVLRETGKLILVLDGSDMEQMIKDKTNRDYILLNYLDRLMMPMD